MKISFQDARQLVLTATYENLVYHAEYETFRSEDIHAHVKDLIGAGYVQRLLRVLADENFVLIDQYDEHSALNYTLSDEGLRASEELPSVEDFKSSILKSHRDSREVPAVDRLVTLDHNQPDYDDIAEGLENAIETVKNVQTNGVGADQKNSLIAGLEAARSLWNAFELNQTQFKIGIIMAVERAEVALKTSFSLVKGPLLMEALKAFYHAAKQGGIS